MKQQSLILAIGVLLFAYVILSRSVVYEHLEEVNSVKGFVPEGRGLYLEAPEGSVFTEILFASYGTPDTSGSQYKKGSCDSWNTTNVVRQQCIGKRSCSIPAMNFVIGDPCSGVGKTLAVELKYDPPKSKPAAPKPPSTPTPTAPTPTAPTPAAPTSAAPTPTAPTSAAPTPTLTQDEKIKIAEQSTGKPLPPPGSEESYLPVYIILGVTGLIAIWGIYSIFSMRSPTPTVVGARRR